MGKDRSGKFHPPKGKPSGVNKEEGAGLVATPPEKLDQYLEITDKYMQDEDHVDPGVRQMHPNRNTSKGEDNFDDDNSGVKRTPGKRQEEEEQ